jgi:hypothetical protein
MGSDGVPFAHACKIGGGKIMLNKRLTQYTYLAGRVVPTLGRILVVNQVGRQYAIVFDGRPPVHVESLLEFINDHDLEPFCVCGNRIPIPRAGFIGKWCSRSCYYFNVLKPRMCVAKSTTNILAILPSSP